MVQLVLHYDGAGFAGWQRQPATRTVQGVLEGALERLCTAPVSALGAGRTDAGVHARGQAVGVRVPDQVGSGRIAAGIERGTAGGHVGRQRSRDERCLSRTVQRHGRRYSYHVGTDEEARSPFRRRWEWALEEPLARDAARALRATRSSARTAFAPSPCRERRPPTTIIAARHSTPRGASARTGCVFEIEANRFLHHMVRFLVGTMIEIARGRRPAADFALLARGRGQPADVRSRTTARALSRSRALSARPLPGRHMKILLDTRESRRSSMGDRASASIGRHLDSTPTLIAEENSADAYHELLAELCRAPRGPVLAPVLAITADDMYRDGKELAKIADNIVVEVPVIEDGLARDAPPRGRRHSRDGDARVQRRAGALRGEGRRVLRERVHRRARRHRATMASRSSRDIRQLFDDTDVECELNCRVDSERRGISARRRPWARMLRRCHRDVLRAAARASAHRSRTRSVSQRLEQARLAQPHEPVITTTLALFLLALAAACGASSRDDQHSTVSRRMPRRRRRLRTATSRAGAAPHCRARARRSPKRSRASRPRSSRCRPRSSIAPTDPFDASSTARASAFCPDSAPASSSARDGVIVTNAHVVAGANTISVAMRDGTTYPARSCSARTRRTISPCSRSTRRACRSRRSAIRRSDHRRVGDRDRQSVRLSARQLRAERDASA